MNPPIQPTAEQREAAEKALGNLVYKLCDHKKSCLCGELNEDLSAGLLANFLAQREALAAYSASQKTRKDCGCAKCLRALE